MRRSLLLVTAVLACSARAASQAPGVSAHDTAEIRTAGSAQRSVRPDLATMTLQFAVEDSTPTSSGQRLAARADSVRRMLAALGIPRDSVVTGSRWYWWGGRIQPVMHNRCIPSPDRRVVCATQVVDTTYVSHETITVRIRDISKVGAVIDSALAHHITDISGVTFSATDVSAARKEVLKEATVHAREEAELIATASGGHLGRVIALTTLADGSNRCDGFSCLVGVTQASGGGGPGTEITAPSVTIAVTVYGRWQLLDRP